eukprot:104848_1
MQAGTLQCQYLLQYSSFIRMWYSFMKLRRVFWRGLVRTWGIIEGTISEAMYSSECSRQNTVETTNCSGKSSNSNDKGMNRLASEKNAHDQILQTNNFDE